MTPGSVPLALAAAIGLFTVAAVARPRGAGDAEDDPRAPDFFAGYAGAATQLWDAALGAFVPMSRQRYRLHAWTLATPVADTIQRYRLPESAVVRPDSDSVALVAPETLANVVPPSVDSCHW